MGNVVNLQSKRNAEAQRLCDAKTAALTRLICAHAVHSEALLLTTDTWRVTLDDLTAAGSAFVAAWHALEDAS
jgi:hypothetical protein